MAPKPSNTDPLSTTLLAFQALVETYILPTLPAPLAMMVRTALNTTTSLQPYLMSTYSTFATLTTKLLTSTSTSRSKQSSSSSSTTTYLETPEATAIISTLIMLLATYISLRTLNYMRRTIMSWIFFFIKLGLLLLGVQAAWYINVYGLNKFVADVAWCAENLWRVVEVVVDGGADADSKKGSLSWNKGSRKTRGSNNNGLYAGREQVPFGGGRTRW